MAEPGQGVPASSPASIALAGARRHLDAGDVGAADRAYGRAVALIGESPALRRLWRDAALEHVEQLQRFGRPTLAAQRCGQYLDVCAAGGWPGSAASLRVRRAEAHAQRLDWHGFRVDLDALADVDLALEDRAALARARAAHAAAHEDHPAARALLREAGEVFRALAHRAGVEAVEHDLRILDAEEGDARALVEITALRPRSDADRIVLARALQRLGHYERAVNVLDDAAAPGGPLDPAVRFAALHQRARLRRILGARRQLRALEPELRAAAAAAPDAPAAQRAVDRVLGSTGADPEVTGVADGTGGDGDREFADRLHGARVTAVSATCAAALDGARSSIAALRSRASSTRHRAHSAYAAAEVELAAGRLTGDVTKRSGHAAAARRALGEAIDLARSHRLIDLHVAALRLLGDVEAELAHDDRTAAGHWAAAYARDEEIAALQPSDGIRVTYLAAAPDEHDRLIQVAFDRFLRRPGPASAAAVVARMEAARGAAMLPAILPGMAPAARAVPMPSDDAACWRWLHGWTEQLARRQAVWMVHLGPGAVVNAVFGRGFLEVSRAPADVQGIGEQIAGLVPRAATAIEEQVAGDPHRFASALDDLAIQVQCRHLLERISPSTSRLAVVAGGVLSEIPVAALPLSGGAPLVSRFALSDLPCLSALAALRVRAARQRGDDCALVRGPADAVAAAGPDPPGGRHRVALLAGDDATPRAVGELLASTPVRVLRMDCHGVHDPTDAARASCLQLAPRGRRGELRPHDVERLALAATGTTVLGACESGMSARRASDERVGFVRSAFLAGSAAVVASRWKAHAGSARSLLDAFGDNLLFLPRDVALQRAQLRLLRGGGDEQVQHPGHPLRWACWTLHGDAGHQTAAGIIRRWTRWIRHR